MSGLGLALGFAYAEDGEDDVDEQITTAAALEEDAERREDHGEDDLANVAGKGKRC